MLETPPDLQKMGHGAAGGVESKSRPSRKNESVDPLHRHLRLEQRRIAQRRRAAIHGDGGDDRLLEHDDRDARGDPLVLS